jgi:hypothetical protein
MSQSPRINLTLHPRQGEAFESDATEILYGGAAGGGKSHFMRVAAVAWCAMVPGIQVYLFRRIQDDLIKNHVEGPKGFRVMLAPMIASGGAQVLEEEIRFQNGSKIFLCHCKDEKHRFKYLGAEIHVLLIDELTTFSEVIYRFLRNRVRAVGLPPQAKSCGFEFPRIVCSSNPGNIGHLWVKRAFVDGVPGEIRQMPPSEGGMRRQFIPAKLEDNPSMLEDDPGYSDRLSGLGNDALVKAMRDGDWDVIEGAFFDCWATEQHVLRPVELPDWWLRFRSADWGSAKPFSVGWWAVAGEDWQHPDGAWIPRGAMIRYREWYGMVPGEPNVGLKMTAGEVGKGIVKREVGDTIGFGVIDPAAFAQDGGPSIAERMWQAGAKFGRADNKRVARSGALGGWDMLRARLVGEDFGEPMGHRPLLYVFSTCVDTIRTLPALQHDENRAEDVDTDQEDHAPDEIRYACMARPWQAKKPSSEKPIVGMQGASMNRLWKDASRQKQQRV